jgi:Tfp pilus assembly protein PilW
MGRSLRDERGFSLLDLMLSLPVSLIILGASIALFLLSQNRISRLDDALTVRREMTDIAIALREQGLCKANFDKLSATGAANLLLDQLDLSGAPYPRKIKIGHKIGKYALTQIQLLRFAPNSTLSNLEFTFYNEANQQNEQFTNPVFVTYNADGSLDKCSTELFFESEEAACSAL